MTMFLLVLHMIEVLRHLRFSPVTVYHTSSVLVYRVVSVPSCLCTELSLTLCIELSLYRVGSIELSLDSPPTVPPSAVYLAFHFI